MFGLGVQAHVIGYHLPPGREGRCRAARTNAAGSISISAWQGTGALTFGPLCLCYVQMQGMACAFPPFGLLASGIHDAIEHDLWAPYVCFLFYFLILE